MSKEDFLDLCDEFRPNHLWERDLTGGFEKTL